MMLGQGALDGRLNPNQGFSSEAVLPFPHDPLAKFGAENFLTNRKGRPWATNNCAAGVEATADNKLSDALLRVVNKPFDSNIYVMPTVLVSWQASPNQKIAAQPRRLPLNFVNPQLAWAPS